MSNNTYFLKVSGAISWGKHTEFQQTVQFIFHHLSGGCLAHELARDVFSPNVYHFFSMWDSKESLDIFRISKEYQVLKGSFQTLGLYESTTTGRLADVQLFEAIEIDRGIA
jgi:quinol monooxygenase YgiN